MQGLLLLHQHRTTAAQRAFAAAVAALATMPDGTNMDAGHQAAAEQASGPFTAERDIIKAGSLIEAGPEVSRSWVLQVMQATLANVHDPSTPVHVRHVASDWAKQLGLTAAQPAAMCRL